MKVERIGFGRYRYVADAPAPVTPAVRKGVIASCADAAEPVHKDEPMRHEGYRRLISSMPCKACGIVGYTQVAHSNYGKGMAIKADDRTCFPLCGDRPGVLGCHTRLDRGMMFIQAVRREVEQAWAADTRRAIEAAGNWPADLPEWKEAA